MVACVETSRGQSPEVVTGLLTCLSLLLGLGASQHRDGRQIPSLRRALCSGLFLSWVTRLPPGDQGTQDMSLVSHIIYGHLLPCG